MGSEKEKWKVKDTEFVGVPWKPIRGREGIDITSRVSISKTIDGIVQQPEKSDQPIV